MTSKAETKQQLLAKYASRKTVQVEGFSLQTLSEWELAELMDSWREAYSTDGEVPITALSFMKLDLLARSIVDESGQLMFTVDELKAFQKPILDRLEKQARTLNGLNNIDEDELAKKSDAVQDSESLVESV